MGLIVGLVFGIADLVITWLAPRQDDTVAALLLFYGPMFFLWVFASFRASQRQQRLRAGVVTGAVVAFATFAVFILLNLVRVNVFLGELTVRADWRNLMARYEASDLDSLRAFVTLDYIRGIPLKLAAATVIGVVMGIIGGALGRLQSWLAPTAPAEAKAKAGHAP